LEFSDYYSTLIDYCVFKRLVLMFEGVLYLEQKMHPNASKMQLPVRIESDYSLEFLIN
jgi:hypothetical protein